MTVRIVTDSSCDLSADEVATHNIEVVPLSIRFGAEEYEDRSELSVEGFYGLMADNVTLPETVAPSPGKFEAAFRRQAEAGADEVVCINISSDLSATMQSAQNAARAVDDDFKTRVIDSKSITAGLGTQVLLAAQAAADGASADDIAALVADISARTRVLGSLDSLDNLKKGGRIGGAQAMLGSLLSIKPMIDISTGKVEEAGKARTRRRALEALAERVFESGEIENLAIMHGMAPDIDTFVEVLAPHHAPGSYRLGHIGAVIGTHGGPRVIGACWVDKK